MKTVKPLITGISLLLLWGCSAKNEIAEDETEKTTCRPYQEAINDGTAPDITSFFIVNGKEKELDYVRDQKYKYQKYCYGHKEARLKELKFIYALFEGNKLPENIFSLHLVGNGKDICHNETFSPDDVSAVMLLYIDSEKYLRLDRINTITHKRESNLVSGGYSSIYQFYMFEVLKLTDNPFLISFKNKNIDKDIDFITIDAKDDTLLKLASMRRMFFY